MSTEQSQEQVDPQLVEQTRQQIRGLVNEIAQLARSEVGQGEFYGQFLDRVVAALAAIGGCVWIVNQNGQMELAHQNNLRDTRLAESPENQALHGRMLQRVLRTGEGTIVAPMSSSSDPEEGGNPTEFLVVLGPLRVDKKIAGIVEVFQRAGAPPNTQRGYLRFLMQMCDLAADYLKTHQLRRFTDRQAMWGQLEAFTRSVHASLEPRETAYTIANEGRRLIECDRVSLAIKRGGKCYIEAVSGQDTFDKRSNTITLLNKLSSAVAATGEPVWYSGDTTNFAPQVEKAIEAYVDDSHSKTVAILPLRKPAPPDAKEGELGPVLGALIVEQIEDARLSDAMLQRVEVVRDHSSAALSNAMEYNGLFLMPLWRALGKSRWLFQGKTLPKTVSAAVAAAAVIAALCIIPYDFALTGSGTLLPRQRQDVFAVVDGEVERVLVKQGDAVRAGQELAVLRSNELQRQIIDAQGRRQSVLEELKAKQFILGKSDVAKDTKDQLAAETRALAVEEASLQEQLQLLRSEEEKLVVRSPRDGVVLTWDVDKNLRNRPVQKGQVLLTVADTAQEWELEVLMPEDRMGHVMQAERELRARDPKARLPVRYHLASNPGDEHLGEVLEIHNLAEVKDPQEGNTVLVRVAIDKNDIEYPQPGVTVKARVQCGRRSVGYVYLHRLIESVQRLIFEYL